MAPGPTVPVLTPGLAAAVARRGLARDTVRTSEVPATTGASRAVPYAARPATQAKAAKATPRGVRPEPNAITLRRREPAATRTTVPLIKRQVPVAPRPRGDVAPRSTEVPEAILAALTLGGPVPTTRGVATAVPEVEGRAVPDTLAEERHASTGLAFPGAHGPLAQVIPAPRRGRPTAAAAAIQAIPAAQALAKAKAIRAVAIPGPVARPLAPAYAPLLAKELLLADLAGVPAEAQGPEAAPVLPATGPVRPTASEVVATTATEAPPARVGAEAASLQVGVKVAATAKGA